MSLVQRIKEHYDSFGVLKVEVPEWGEEGKPLLVYYTPLTLAEKNKLQQIGERDGYVARLADALIMKALDAEGKKLFTLEDRIVLRNHADSDVIARVVMEMMRAAGPEEQEKNLPRTPDSS